MHRYRITVEYDGGPFVGWQRQADQRSIQGALEGALLRLSGETATIRGAGRTDRGVHATGQVAHFDLERHWAADRLAEGLNAHLRPDPVAIVAAREAAADFDARFSAIRRHYRYRIVNRRAPLALERGKAWRVTRPLDAEAMDAAAQALVGTHDFSTFRAAECQAKSPVKTLDRLRVERQGDAVVITASARSFLHSQVRSITGSLKLVGDGKWEPEAVRAALQARSRAACAPLAPPEGLYLVAVDYLD